MTHMAWSTPSSFNPDAHVIILILFRCIPRANKARKRTQTGGAARVRPAKRQAYIFVFSCFDVLNL